MAVSVVLAVDSIADTLVDKIAERMATLRTGDGLRGCDMGPLITSPISTGTGRGRKARTRRTMTIRAADPQNTVRKLSFMRAISYSPDLSTATMSSLSSRERIMRADDIAITSTTPAA